MSVDQKSLETVFSIAICPHSGHKQQSTALFLTILDVHVSSSIVIMFLIAAFLKCLLNTGLLKTEPKQFKTRATKNNLHFSCLLRKKKIVSTQDRRQSITLNNRRTRTRNCYNQCFQLPFVDSRVTNGKRKLCF